MSSSVHTNDGLALRDDFGNLGGSLFLRDNGPEETLVELDRLTGDLVGELGVGGDRELDLLDGGGGGDIDLPGRREGVQDLCGESELSLLGGDLVAELVLLFSSGNFGGSCCLFFEVPKS
jgi:hypothetical protein